MGSCACVPLGPGVCVDAAFLPSGCVPAWPLGLSIVIRGAVVDNLLPPVRITIAWTLGFSYLLSRPVPKQSQQLTALITEPTRGINN